MVSMFKDHAKSKQELDQTFFKTQSQSVSWKREQEIEASYLKAELMKLNQTQDAVSYLQQELL